MKDFLNLYRFNFKEIKPNDSNCPCALTTEVVRMQENRVVLSVDTNFNINSINEWMQEMHSPIALNKIDWEMLIEQAKRSSLYQLAILIPITDFLDNDLDINSFLAS